MNNDLISRKYIQEQIPELDSYDDGFDIWLKREDVDNLINNAPTIKTYCYFCGQTEHGKVEEKPQGKWVFDKENSFTIDMFKCSICGYFGDTHFNFCPNCGADMRGGAE